MRRGPKSAKPKVEAEPPASRKPSKNGSATVSDLAKRLAESLKREAEAREQLQTRDRELAEVLEQQTATAEILGVISRSPTELQPVLDTLIENACRLCSADKGFIYRIDGDGGYWAAIYNAPPELMHFLAQNPVRRARNSVTGRVLLERRTIHIDDVRADPDYNFVEGMGVRTTLGVPLLREGALLGVIIIYRHEVRPFSDRQVALLQTFADQAVIAIENVRLFNETKEALEQQTATAEILRVISSSPTDVQPVYDSIVERAARLCDAEVSLVARLEGEWIHVGAVFGTSVAGTDAVRQTYPMRPGAAGATARAIRDSAIVHIPDVLTDPEFTIRDAALTAGFRAVLAVPMLREGCAIGAISIGRAEAGEFSTEQVNLLRTFAAQAVIAIQNVRLFKELEARNAELTDTLARQMATGEVLRAISRAQTDAQPVFDIIAESAQRLCGAGFGQVALYDGALLHMTAFHNVNPEGVEALRRRFPAPADGGSAMGRVLQTRAVVQIADVVDDPAYAFKSELQTMGFQSLLAVPMLRNGEPIGAIGVGRRERGAFPDKQITLLETFAAQAVIAIENVRLFKELEASNREIGEKSSQIEVASQHKSEFLANMSHELRTPLNAIIGFSEVLTDRMFGELNEKQDEYLKDIYASGTHLLSLINDILDLSKIEAGRMELELTDFHLPTALDNALTLVRERAGRRNITLQMSVDERLGEVRSDERKIRQVVLNLLSNAIKFTPEGGRIEVAAVPKDGSVEVSVSDTGVGIAPEDQEAIFEEFRQVGTAEKKAEGTGLGLTLCRKFIELHGGKIWVKSQIGAGSTFTFTIPVRHGYMS
jgi:signal transduction histidine kinase